MEILWPPRLGIKLLDIRRVPTGEEAEWSLRAVEKKSMSAGSSHRKRHKIPYSTSCHSNRV
jgi:hypothetical protein